MKSIGIFINACLAYATISTFNGFTRELIHQLANSNYSASIEILPIGILSFIIGSIACNNIYRIIKGE